MKLKIQKKHLIPIILGVTLSASVIGITTQAVLTKRTKALQIDYMHRYYDEEKINKNLIKNNQVLTKQIEELNKQKNEIENKLNTTNIELENSINILNETEKIKNEYILANNELSKEKLQATNTIQLLNSNLKDKEILLNKAISNIELSETQKQSLLNQISIFKDKTLKYINNLLVAINSSRSHFKHLTSINSERTNIYNEIISLHDQLYEFTNSYLEKINSVQINFENSKILNDLMSSFYYDLEANISIINKKKEILLTELMQIIQNQKDLIKGYKTSIEDLNKIIDTSDKEIAKLNNLNELQKNKIEELKISLNDNEISLSEKIKIIDNLRVAESLTLNETINNYKVIEEYITQYKINTPNSKIENMINQLIDEYSITLKQFIFNYETGNANLITFNNNKTIYVLEDFSVANNLITEINLKLSKIMIDILTQYYLLNNQNNEKFLIVSKENNKLSLENSRLESNIEDLTITNERNLNIITSLTNDKNILVSRVKEIEGELIISNTQNENLRAELENIKLKISQKDEEINNLRNIISENNEKINGLVNERNNLKEQLEQANLRLIEELKNKQYLESKIAILNSTITRLKDELASKDAELNELNKKYKNNLNLLLLAKVENTKLKIANEELNSKIDELNDKINEFNNKNNEFNDQLNILRKENEELIKRNEQLSSELAEAEIKIRELISNEAKFMATINAYKTDIDFLNNKVREIVTSIKELLAKIKSMTEFMTNFNINVYTHWEGYYERKRIDEVNVDSVNRIIENVKNTKSNLDKLIDSFLKNLD
ncbi:hypothetical protein [Mycoplasma anserisalpingitidis]|uniref:Uncharacterized protein n=1 Tax=Mycoplasma anserisalpingitidis TaxID=519450 RepID=A0A5B8KBD9_9MOLU|nr:hypothetical protein [Mycoplasma anserisalpingitidis]QDY88377.1 hypothetical protein FOY43_01715 [Mycoplasma anserisalpingitidis]